ncbi:hypothetical protein SK128_004644 [Halocaridina rubra]|uniref:Serine/threonine-protein kinase WNK CCTL2 domain-containing protein n=1 Tax=Halocaridina rubra TaxID=373956 RepID=A0AAN9A2T7_HALRR
MAGNVPQVISSAVSHPNMIPAAAPAPSSISTHMPTTVSEAVQAGVAMENITLSTLPLDGVSLQVASSLSELAATTAQVISTLGLIQSQPSLSFTQQDPSSLQMGLHHSQLGVDASQPAALQSHPAVVPSLPGVVSSITPLGTSQSTSASVSEASQLENSPSPQTVLTDLPSHLLNDRPGGNGVETQTQVSICAITSIITSCTTTTTTLCTQNQFDPSAASESECSEHPADGSGNKHTGDRKRIRKKKTLDRFPKLNVLSVTDTMVECQLETIKQKTITFKFDITDNDPQDVANKLVMTNLLPGNHAEVVVNYIEDIIRQLQANPNVLPTVCTPGLDSKSQHHSQESHARSPSASRKHKDDNDNRVRISHSYFPV